MTRGVMGPLLITAVVVAVGNGWILSAWNWVYTASHSGTGVVAAATPAATKAIGAKGGAIAARAPGIPPP